MGSNIHRTKTNCADLTYVIKVSNSSESTPPPCISKNEINEKKKGVSIMTPLFFRTYNSNIVTC